MHDDALLSSKVRPKQSPPSANGDSFNRAVPAMEEANCPSALSFDADEFIQYVKDHDLSEAEAFEFLATVWVYIVAFVDLGFGIHPLQQTQAIRRQHGDEGDAALDHESALVLTCKETFNKRTNEKTVRHPKRRAGRKDS